MRSTLDARIAALEDRAAIMDTLARYCRGIDRCEVETLKSVYWPDGVDDHGTFVGLGHDFAEAVTPRLLEMKQTMHAIANATIELMGDWARVETYIIAYHLLAGDGGDQEMIVGGRYLDRFEKRGGAWRIKHRLYVMDWNQNGPATAIWDRGLFAQLKTRGARGADDPWETAPHLRSSV